MYELSVPDSLVKNMIFFIKKYISEYLQNSLHSNNNQKHRHNISPLTSPVLSQVENRVLISQQQQQPQSVFNSSNNMFSSVLNLSTNKDDKK